MDFEDWETVQSALTHYSFIGARRNNNVLSRLGEKFVRFVLTSEIQNSDPEFSRKDWFIVTNLRYLTSFYYVATVVEQKLKISPFTRYSDNELVPIKPSGTELTNLDHSIVSKSIYSIAGTIYLEKGEKQAREFVIGVFLYPYSINGKFVAPLYRQTQIFPSGRL